MISNVSALVFFDLYLFPGEKQNCLHAMSTFKVGKNFIIGSSAQEKCRLWREINTFASISLLIGCILSIFRQKMYEPNPMERDIKGLIPAPTQ